MSQQESDKESGYDPELDEVVKDLGEVVASEKGGVKFTVRVMAYNGGKAKVEIRKVGRKWSSANLGRIEADVFSGLLPLFVEAEKWAKTHNEED